MKIDHAGRIAFALLCLGGSAGWAQRTPQPSTVIHTETRTVLVEAIVTGKKGEYVRDLTAKDFRIWQDGKEQAVTSLSLESTAAEPHFLVLFFDSTRMTAQDQAQARLAVSRFIDANAAPNRLMAVVSYVNGLRVAQNFTDNPGRLKDALSRLEVSTGIVTAARPPGGVVDDNFLSRNMLQTLAALANGLGVLPGRKTVMLLTGGLLSSSEEKSEVTEAIESSSRSGVAIYPIDVQPATAGMGPLQDPVRAPDPTQVDLRGGLQGGEDSSPLAQDLSASGQPLLRSLANGTGGFFVPNSGNLLPDLQRIGEEQTAYYVLSYTPPESKEGSCHTLRVKVDRAGAAVRARSSYCATKPLDLIAGTPAAKDLEDRAAGAETGKLRASIQLPYFYASPGVARVHVALEIAPDELKFENQKGKFHAEVNFLGIAVAPDGGIGARFSDTLELDFDNQAEIEKLKEAPVHYEKEFKIAPGTYSFTLAFGQGGADFGKIEAPLTVDPWNGTELAISSVALSRETHPSGDLGLVSSLVADRTPLVAGGTQFVPSGSNEFAKSSAGFFYIEVYDTDPSSLSLRVRVLDSSGESKWDSGVTKPPAPGAGKLWIAAGAKLPLSSLAAGSYRLEITASDSGGRQVRRTADFEVK